MTEHVALTDRSAPPRRRRAMAAGLALAAVAPGSAMAVEGALDTSFGGDSFGGRPGVRILADAGAPQPQKVLLDGSGRLYVVGDQQHLAGARASLVQVTRLLPDGRLDTAYARNGDLAGSATVNGGGLGNVGVLDATAVGSRIVVSATNADKGVLIRFDASGALDRSWDGDGRKDVNFPFDAVVAQGTGLVAGWDLGPKLVITRLNDDGSLDYRKEAPVPPGVSAMQAVDVARDGQGRIVVLGLATRGGGRDFAIARFTQAGDPDTSFGNGGIALTQISDAGLSARTLVITGSGYVVVGGTTVGSAGRVVMTRFSQTGTIDSSFGGSGFVGVGLAGSSGSVSTVRGAFVDNGRLVLAVSHSTASGPATSLMRFGLANGAHDSSFAPAPIRFRAGFGPQASTVFRRGPSATAILAGVSQGVGAIARVR